MKRLVRFLSETHFAVALGLWFGGVVLLTFAFMCSRHIDDPNGGYAFGETLFGLLGSAGWIIGGCILFNLVMGEIYDEIIKNGRPHN